MLNHNNRDPENLKRTIVRAASFSNTTSLLLTPVIEKTNENNVIRYYCKTSPLGAKIGQLGINLIKNASLRIRVHNQLQKDTTKQYISLELEEFKWDINE